MKFTIFSTLLAAITVVSGLAIPESDVVSRTDGVLSVATEIKRASSCEEVARGLPVGPANAEFDPLRCGVSRVTEYFLSPQCANLHVEQPEVEK
ncbi:hypothetical protein C8F04DRAFT_1246989 [Mycena alexandri]|uniref:Uncharacterized protein n=1 Tax=Mycena alexandri TaxID=1745969 RepID=A0AAD6XJF3_9AGAR|nr:hypothetical protein C8F04DRAFT_1246989 [Mycena alexandri]